MKWGRAFKGLFSFLTSNVKIKESFGYLFHGKSVFCVLHLLVVYTLRVRRIFHCSLTQSSFWLENTVVASRLFSPVGNVRINKHRHFSILPFFMIVLFGFSEEEQQIVGVLISCRDGWLSALEKSQKELFHGPYFFSFAVARNSKYMTILRNFFQKIFLQFSLFYLLHFSFYKNKCTAPLPNYHPSYFLFYCFLKS